VTFEINQNYSIRLQQLTVNILRIGSRTTCSYGSWFHGE